jgi:hypothetical protein
VNALGLAATRQPQMTSIMDAVMLAHVVELVAGEFLQIVFDLFDDLAVVKSERETTDALAYVSIRKA